MDPEISEFSFGFALTSELINDFGLKPAGAPEFATQYAEGKAGGGWDMKLPGTPVFIQFKRSYRMVKRSAKESSDFPSLPFYRMYLHRRDHSDQHELLLELESLGNLVLYAAPGFSESTELNEAYSNDRMGASSLFLRPSQIGPLLDDKQHWVAFQMDPELTYFCSEPRRIKTDNPKTLFQGGLAREIAKKSRKIDAGFFSHISDELLEVYGRKRPSEAGKVRQVRERRSPPEFAQLIAQTLFDCELLLYVG